MRRFFVFFSCLLLLAGLLAGCSGKQIDRSKELKQAMDTSDSKWTQAFPEGNATFQQVADYIAGWGSNAGLDVTKVDDHYLVLTNPASKGQKKVPSVTMALSVDPSQLREGIPLLSLGMTAALGSARHGQLRLIVTEATGEDLPGARSLSSKYMDCDHFIYLYGGTSPAVYAAGPLSAQGTLTCTASRKKPAYDNAFEISIQIPEGIDPYSFEKESSLPDPVNVLGDLLASAKSSGRLFEIASFTSEADGDALPSSAKAVVVIDDNNVEAFTKRFNTSLEAFTKRFGQWKPRTDASGEAADAFTYTMEPTDLPKKVLKPSVSDNIISLMYTLQTGIHLQDEEAGGITAASYIRSVSTKGDTFSLVMDMRSRDQASMEEMSGNYLITSGLCDVKYREGEAHRLWSAARDSSLAAWFIASVNESGDDTTYLQSSECDLLYSRGDQPDMIAYRYSKDHRGTALKNLIAYFDSFTE